MSYAILSGSERKKEAYWPARYRNPDTAGIESTPVHALGPAGNMAIQRRTHSDALAASCRNVDELDGGVRHADAGVQPAADAGVQPADAGKQPAADAGAQPADAGKQPAADAGAQPADAGKQPAADAGAQPADAGKQPADAGAKPADAAPPAPAACARPINWIHGPNASDNGAEGIRIQITWESSTGNLADLSNCQIREVVNYEAIPDPPFALQPANPTILTVDAALGQGNDTHSYATGLHANIRDPRVSGVMISHQTYQWRCTSPGCPADWTDWPGETYDITRRVFPLFAYRNPWRYSISKVGTGAGNTFKYSREVEIPKP